LASANPLDAPLIDPAFLQDPDDVEKLVRAMMKKTLWMLRWR
jgi:hypothetical protein